MPRDKGLLGFVGFLIRGSIFNVIGSDSLVIYGVLSERAGR